MERIIGRYGKYGAAKTFIIFAGVHGNEKAGIIALQELLDDYTTKQIPFDGAIIGIAGNLMALENNVRYVHKDLNRQWYLSKIKKLGALPFGLLNTVEDIEQKQILELIQDVVSDKGKTLMLIDLHTTSAKGGCFSITNNHPRSEELALSVPVPVINKMTEQISGTTLEYFEAINLPGIAFEAGQHTEEISVHRMKAALHAIFCNTSCLSAEYNDLYQEEFEEMQNTFAHLPRNVDVIYRHPIHDHDEFVMNSGYTNFQEIKKGEELAKDKFGPIYSPHDGLILMPLYQKKGSDGFFIVKEVK